VLGTVVIAGEATAAHSLQDCGAIENKAKKKRRPVVEREKERAKNCRKEAGQRKFLPQRCSVNRDRDGAIAASSFPAVQWRSELGHHLALSLQYIYSACAPWYFHLMAHLTAHPSYATVAVSIGEQTLSHPFCFLKNRIYLWKCFTR
jgi:hypothetical protein